MTIQGMCLHSNTRQEAKLLPLHGCTAPGLDSLESAAGHRDAKCCAEYGDKRASLFCYQLPWSISGEHYVFEARDNYNLLLECYLGLVWCLGIMPLAEHVKDLV